MNPLAPPVHQTPKPVPVLIVGGGPVGLSLAALLGHHGIAALVVEADAGYCTGSRAICISRRSQEILGWVGADQPLRQTGLPWVGGRSHYREQEVLHFRMPSEPSERFAPMLNIQQYHVEAFAHQAAQRQPVPADVRWATRMVSLQQHGAGVLAEVEDAEGQRQTISADWLVACDGGRSTVRDQLGLQLKGMQYEGRYVIVDIEQASERAVERLAWFDPPSNPGSTLLMHRQPGNVWRVDYQVRDDEDPAEAVKPENVLPRVASHLQMIGETAPWKPLWISIYNAKCLTLDDYRHGRVLFAGDAAHLVPIFGVRGLNSGLDDAANLAWKLAAVVQGVAPALLDSYTAERRPAALENMAHGAKSTEFMAPPNFAFKLLREAALRLALLNPAVRSLINPRQSVPVAYSGSPLNQADAEPWSGGAPPGTPAPEALLQAPAGTAQQHLSQQFGHGFVLLYFSNQPTLPAGLLALQDQALLCVIAPPGCAAPSQAWIDVNSEAWQRFDASDGTLVLIRPDAYVLGRWRAPRWADLRALLQRFVA